MMDVLISDTSMLVKIFELNGNYHKYVVLIEGNQELAEFIDIVEDKLDASPYELNNLGQTYHIVLSANVLPIIIGHQYNQEFPCWSHYCKLKIILRDVTK